MSSKGTLPQQIIILLGEGWGRLGGVSSFLVESLCRQCGGGAVCVHVSELRLGCHGEIQTGVTSRSVLHFNGAGIQMLWADAKKARRIKANMWKHNVKFHQLSYREMEHLRQVWARDKYPGVHGEVINQDPTFVSFVSCSSLVIHFPWP